LRGRRERRVPYFSRESTSYTNTVRGS